MLMNLTLNEVHLSIGHKTISRRNEGEELLTRCPHNSFISLNHEWSLGRCAKYSRPLNDTSLN